MNRGISPHDSESAPAGIASQAAAAAAEAVPSPDDDDDAETSWADSLPMVKVFPLPVCPYARI
jgi:hypothetical protein